MSCAVDGEVRVWRIEEIHAAMAIGPGHRPRIRSVG
jgi:hypothetical protein